VSQHVNPTHAGPAMTTWTNPLDVPQRVTFNTGETRLLGRRRDPETGTEVNAYSQPTTETYEVPARGEAEIPSEWDGAIHRVHDGAVIGGLAPLLIRKDQKYGLDPALIPVPEVARPRGGVMPEELAARLRAQAAPAADDAMVKARAKRAAR
jgi:hypothetical protein